MISLPTLPTWKMLLRAMIPGTTSLEELTQPWIRSKGDHAGWLSKSSWSLALISRWRQVHNCGNTVSLWVPDYFCNQALMLVREAGVNLHFYPIKADLSPDFDYIRNRSRQSPPDLFLIVHYFGKSNLSSDVIEFSKSTGAWLIEDATHVLRPHGKIGVTGDFVLYSPHKLLALPDGALLIAREEGPNVLSAKCIEKFGDVGHWAATAAELKIPVSNRYPGLKWIFKRTLQKMGFGRSSWRTPSEGPPSIRDFPRPSMSKFSRRLIQYQIDSLACIFSERRRNKLLLDYLLTSQGQETHSQNVISSSDNQFCPYVAAYKTPHFKEVSSKLLELGVPVTTWPDLPPELESNPNLHSCAIDLKKGIIFLPIHQSIKRAELAGLLSNDCYDHDDLKWNLWCGTEEKWSELVDQTEYGNLLQSWKYGDFKSETEGWGVIRMVAVCNGSIVGCVQVLFKRFLGFFEIYRINRGPLFFGSLPVRIQASFWKIIRFKFGRLWLGKILLWAPATKLSGENLTALLRFGFRERSRRGYTTYVLDLKCPEQQMFSGLSSSWRTALRAAYRHNVDVVISNSEDDFKALLSRCSDMMGERKLRFDANFYLLLYRKLSSSPFGNLQLHAKKAGVLLGSVYVTVHGQGATYTLGWNGEEGRRCSAHHLLLWEAAKHLRAIGIHFFDLGGADEVKTPSIYKFKKGMGGERLEFIGEGICF